VFAHAIASRPVDLGQREEKREEKKKIKIHIVPSVILLLCSRSSNLFAFAHALQQQQDFLTKIFLFFYTMNIIDEVSCKKRGREREKVICRELL
jgi:hypothetical protein